MKKIRTNSATLKHVTTWLLNYHIFAF